MTPPHSLSRQATQSVPVYPAEAFTVVDGASIDDTLGIASEAVLDDAYELSSTAQQLRLTLSTAERGFFRIAEDTGIGTPGALIVVDSCLTVMSTVGTPIDLLILVELDEEQMIERIHVVALAPISPSTTYRLVGIDRETAALKLAQVACVAFTKGTMITLPTGAQRPIEALQPGDEVLTRDDGPQVIRWIGQRTLRAIGDFAPVVIKAGVLNNSNDLIMSPEGRLFIYQRRDALGAGRSEVLVKARHLLNEDTVYCKEGGFVEYYQLLFDDHQIIYAEGIAAETLLIDPRTRPALNADVSPDVLAALTRHSDWLHSEFEVQPDLLGPDAVDKLRKASKR